MTRLWGRRPARWLTRVMHLTATLLLLAPFIAFPALADKRVALIIGNGAYKHATPLPNPTNDAADMAAELKKLKFTVIDGLDLDKAAMDRKIRDFATALQGADVGVFFYSGHGLQVSGVNYLVPTDAEAATTAALDFEMVRLDLIQRTMEREAKTNILFLDACRNNPLTRNLARAMGTRAVGIGRGLAAAESGVGTLISFSTQPGNVASDGTGRNSPFTGPLVKTIATPGEDVLTTLTAVRNEVLSATGDTQVPWENHALRAKFYFNPVPAAAVAVGTPTPPVQAQPAPQPPMSDAAQAWSLIKDTTSPADLESFIRRFGDTFFGDLAKTRLANLKAAILDNGEQLRVAMDRAEARKAAEAAEAARKKAEAEAAKTPQPGQVFRDCTNCPEMVVVPAGSFTMGSNDVGSDENPPHKVTIAKPFAVGKFTVTFDEWDACVSDGGCKTKPNDAKWGRAKRPVIYVSWNDVTTEYLPWLSKKTGKPYRLLSEAEWEYAARAKTTTRYPWGDDIGQGNANCSGCGSQWDNKQTAPVGSFKPDAFGLYDMHGNVWQWVEDTYHDSYKEAPTDGSAWQAGDASLRVLRGGSWINHPDYLRSASRDRYYPTVRYLYIGFRLARTL